MGDPKVQKMARALGRLILLSPKSWHHGEFFFFFFSGDFWGVRNVKMAFACDASGVQQKMPTGLVPRQISCGSCGSCES